MDISDRFRGCLLGLAVGDAVGTTVEFQPRGTFAPVTDMVGGGPFYLEPGQWTDDTSMALCLATSLVEKGQFDAADQMNRYCDWYENGYLSSTGTCFDIGNTVTQALNQYKKTGNPFSGSTHPKSSGNGCLMRLAPVPMFCHPDRDRTVYFSGESSRTTHGATECVEASRLFGEMLFHALSGANKTEILEKNQLDRLTSPSIRAIAKGEFKHKTVTEIRGSGYVVKSLEAALWCFWTSETFEQAVLKATNLGDDADTTAAICGQLAGAFYGVQGIPRYWLERLTMKEEIVTLADQLYAAI
ncbi:ADP-ribosylglycohydrolase family protein [Acaryochloris marina]|uniref:ADP-ribosylglycohydrolase n=1 Tax=Acaryochloris marina (strain MBIC 11017) TaxID=329726 RepID=B0CEH6_ACAM1|nr:ADP-ribosylglycohydrolase family protein [Acaryochloris marina]ABW26942.1 ADP-ribosylglycohydrolase [Acaryochloris marina MBIC11017]BDM81710.1 ADP-ribosylglycohydrolase [Acaryochloris marina MBIC10699]